MDSSLFCTEIEAMPSKAASGHLVSAPSLSKRLLLLFLNENFILVDVSGFSGVQNLKINYPDISFFLLAYMTGRRVTRPEQILTETFREGTLTCFCLFLKK